MSLRIGIDFGGVLSSHDGKENDQEHRETKINMKDAITSLKTLKDKSHKLYLISFCGKSRAIETKKATEEQAPEIFDRMIFVKDKKYKKDATKFLGCDVMIDDRLDILIDIAKSGACPNMIWFTGDPNFNDQSPTPQNILRAESWNDILVLIEKMEPFATPDQSVNLSKKTYKL